MLKIKCVYSSVKVHILASASVPYTLTTVQVPILAITHTKRITVWFILHDYMTFFLHKLIADLNNDA